MPRPCGSPASNHERRDGWGLVRLRFAAGSPSSSVVVHRGGAGGRWEAVFLIDNRPRSLPEDPVAAPCIPFGLHSPIDVDVLWLALDLGHPGNTRGTGSAASGGASGAKRKIWSVDWSVWGSKYE